MVAPHSHRANLRRRACDPRVESGPKKVPCRVARTISHPVEHKPSLGPEYVRIRQIRVLVRGFIIPSTLCEFRKRKKQMDEMRRA